MDLVRVVAALAAIIIVLTYVVINDVPAHMGDYVNQPYEIVHKALEELGSSVVIPNIGINGGDLTRALKVMGSLSNALSIGIPNPPIGTAGGLVFMVPAQRAVVSIPLGINVQSYNKDSVTLRLINYGNCTLVISNVTGNYVVLSSRVVIPPMGIGYVVLTVTNPTALYQSYMEGNEVLTMDLTACGVSTTVMYTLGSQGNVSIPIPSVGSGIMSIGVRNNYPFEVVIYNITGEYIRLVKPVDVRPGGVASAEFYVSNYTGFYELWSGNREVINATMRLGNALVSGEFLIGRGINITPISVGGSVEVNVTNNLGTEVMMYSMQGPYIELAAPKPIPLGISVITVNVSNYYGLYRSIELGNEDIVMTLGIHGVNITVTATLGGAVGIRPRNAVLSVAVENPLNYTLFINNITGPNLHLLNSVAILPEGRALVRLLITNVTSIVNETITLDLTLMGVNLTEVFMVTSLGIEPVIMEVPIRNPLNVSMVIMNVTNEYLHLTTPVFLAPHGVGVLRIRIINIHGLSGYVNVTAEVGNTVIRLRVRL
ncbi:hypothetical protein [Vulcanisaeta sp. JCM 16161]|uniref:hypothetical protein n=1 Tax=Vulcanisaeta sp. JCM 16161 TaxID=1295372 RepID=UPI0006D04BA5|nr:hypothetical protein [Vulcanisaeta sp. JCM 16161]